LCRSAGSGGRAAVKRGMKRVPAAVREILTLVVALAIFLVAFSIAFPTSHG